MKKKNKILITGAAGFIGSHAVDLFLKKNFIVHGLDNLSSGNLKNLYHHNNNKNFKFEKIDLLNLKSNCNFIKECNIIIHFAGSGDIVPSIKYPKFYFANNVTSTINLIDQVYQKKINKFVYAASSSCYGFAKTPTDESHPIAPMYPYALSKYLGEQICLHYYKVYKLPFNSIRIFNAYGPRSRTSGAYGAVMGVFLKQKLEKKPFTVVGDGKQKRDFLYISDVVDAFYKASFTKITGQIWNLGNGNPISINYLCSLLGSDNKKIYLPKRPGEPDVTYANINKIKKDLHWKPEVTFEEGIKIVLSKINYWNNAPLWTPRLIKEATKMWFNYLK
jgi:UDP-glucose 4-epimerase